LQQIGTFWAGLNNRRRLVIVAATLAMFVAIIAMSRLASQPSMTLLYAGLDSSAAGEVVRALERDGVTFDVRGDAIFVDSRMRDATRMTLASEGLPTTGGRGYELLDGLSGFGTTSQMFDAAYWRAKEGELARTIVASQHIAQARVHIANAGSNPFRATVQPTASVSVTASGAPVTATQANAIRFLVASAVAGLTAENVAVIDSRGVLIDPPESAAATTGGSDRADTLRDRVQRLVEARVGRGNAVVEVSVDTVTETETIRERRFDPNGRVAISTDTEERADTSEGSSGAVTVASNLPDGDGAEGGDNRSQATQTRERVNYEVSETEREVQRAAGAVKRLTVAVLVNGLEQVTEAGETRFVPRPEAELAALRDLVASAVGFDEARGDVITLRSMELPAVAPEGTGATQSLLSGVHLDLMRLIQLGILAVVSLILGLFVIRPILSRKTDGGMVAALPPMAPGAGTSQSAQFEGSAGAPAGQESGTMLQIADGSAPVTEPDTIDRLRALIGERQEDTVEVLRNWLEEKEEKAS
jgi:flagellar M-ring protein FliF